MGLAGLHLAVLWAFAFAQPLLDVLGDTPEFFVARGNTRADIVLLAFGLMLLPPLALTAIEAVVGRVSEPLRRAVHLALVALLVAAFALQLIKDALSVRSSVMIATALMLGALAALVYARTAAGPAALTVLGPAPLVFLFVFLVISPASKLVLDSTEASAAGVKVPGEPPVVVILFDEFAGYALEDGRGSIDASRYPNFARFARDATWYRNATTVADYTDRAVPALLTGEHPDKAALPIASDHPESLFALLGDTYSFDVTEPMTNICPERLCPEEAAHRQSFRDRMDDLVHDLSLVSLHLLLPDPLRNELPPVDRSFGDFGGPDDERREADAASRGFAALAAVIDRMPIFRAFERRLGRAPRGGHLAFFHIQMPHNPYHYLPDGRRYPETVDPMPGLTTEGQPAGGGWSKDPQLARQGLQRYLLQLGDTDRLLGRLLDRLQARGIYDRALVVALADHGASFIAGTPHRAANPSNLPAIAGIPLLIKAPGQHDGRVDESNVHITDVLPTMADRLGIDLPWPTAGRSADRATDDGTIALQPQYGDADLTMPFTEYQRRRDKLVQWMRDDFGAGPKGVYRAGPDADLTGTSVDALASAKGRFEVDGGGLLSAVDPDGPIVPALISGTVSGVPAAARLAVAVEGRVAGQAVRFRDGEAERFSAVVGPAAFVTGANRVDLVVVTGSGVGRRLSLLRGAGLAYRLVERGGRERILDGTGRVVPVVSGSGGELDKLDVGQAEVKVEGWAGDGVHGRPAVRVLAFSGSRFLASARPSVPRRDVAQSHGRALARSGFRLRGWAGGPRPGSAAAPVRVFAVVDGHALEIRTAQAP